MKIVLIAFLVIVALFLGASWLAVYLWPNMFR